MDGSQPSARRPITRSDRGPNPPTHTGTGRAGLGSSSASCTEYTGPWNVKAGSRHNPRRICSASSRPSTFSFGVRTGSPNAENSASQPPAPRPMTTRPPESRSRVSAILASTAGDR